MARLFRLLLVGCVAGVLLGSCSRGTPEIRSLEDAREASIGVMTGSTGEQHAVRYFPDARVQRFDFILDAITALKAEQLDAAIVARTEAVYVERHNPNLRYLPEPIALEYSAIALRKGRDSLLLSINAIIDALETEGLLDDMHRRWFETEGPPYEVVKISLPDEGEPLVVGVNAAHEPFGFIDAQKEFSGYDAELGRRIGAALGRPVVFKDMVFSALLPALVSGKIDLIINDLTITEERKQSVDFSRPYFENASVLLVRTPQGADDGASRSGEAGEIPVTLRGPSVFRQVADGFYRNIILENRYLLIVDGLKATVLITLLAALLGTILGAVICALRMSRRVMLRGFAQLYISVLRGTPVLVFLMIVYYVVFASVNISPLIVAVFAFALNMAAYVSEMFRTGIESVDKGQVEAGIAMGFSKTRTFIHIVLPQALRRIVPVYTGELISQMKMTSVVGYIAVQDLTKAGDIIRSRTFDAFFPLIMVAVMYFVFAWLLMWLLQLLEKKIDPRVQLQRRNHD